LPPGFFGGAIFSGREARMILTCDKYKIKMESETARCEHLEEYCKLRGACIINFLTRERLRREQAEGEGEHGKEESGDE
jgi:hypothetical protein